MECDVVIVGGGAAGLYCAGVAGKRGLRVVVLEHEARVGNKILISGGGRCNFTNTGASPSQYLTSGSPHFIKSALARHSSREFLALVERHQIPWHEKKLGQLFCDVSSRQIVEMLLSECQFGSVKIQTGSGPLSVRWNSTNRRYEVTGSRGVHTAPALVVATGGLSFPKLGASPWAYRVAEQFGIRVVPPRPGLVPLTWNTSDSSRFAPLSGLSVDCVTQAGEDAPTFRENLLFTHRGLSGPSILQISSYWKAGGPIRINLVPDAKVVEIIRAAKSTGREIKAVLKQWMPERLAIALGSDFPEGRPLAQWPQRDLEQLQRRLEAWEILPAGDEGYPKAEVTVGGIDTAELSSKTMECRRQPGLYFIGEAVDITGWLGGYNFQWAWSSGHAVGEALTPAMS